MPMTKGAALMRTARFIRDNCDPPVPPHYNVDIYLWDTPDVRVAEISISNSTGGSSWMQGDIAARLIIFNAERLILAYMTEGQDGWPPDDVEMAEIFLQESLVI